MPRHYKKRYNRNRSLAAKAYALAKKAYKAPELKYHTLTGTIVGPDNDGTTTSLSTIAQGTDVDQRIGNVINPTSVTIKGKMNLHASAAATQIRVIIYRWVSEAPNAVTDVLQAATIQSFKSELKRFQSQILYDRVFQLDSVNRPELYFQKKVMLGKFMGFTEGSNLPNRNAIHLIILSDETTNVPLLAYQTRMFYKDS